MLSLPACLFEDAVLGSGCDVIAGFPGDRHTTWLSRVLELTMASFRGDQVPTVIFEHGQDFGDLHRLPEATHRQRRRLV